MSPSTSAFGRRREPICVHHSVLDAGESAARRRPLPIVRGDASTVSVVR